MSFASDVKKEIIANDFTIDELKAELYAVLKLKSEMVISFQRFGLNIKTTSLSLSRRLIYIIKKIYNINIEILSKERNNLDKKNVYIINVTDNVKEMLLDLDIIDEDYNFKEEISNKYDEFVADVIRGMFIAKGSINDPSRSRYHLEISCTNEFEAKYLVEKVYDYGIDGKMSIRRGSYIFYIKRGEHIGDFLKLIGASNTLFEFENDRIKRDLNNVINRVSNCDLANGTKAMISSDKQMEWIRIIKEHMGFEKLSVRLMEAVTLRVKNEGASLQELSDISEEEVGRYISKSGLAHCMKDLEIIAMSLINKNKK